MSRKTESFLLMSKCCRSSRKKPYKWGEKPFVTQKRQPIVHQGLQRHLQGSSFSADTNQEEGKRDWLTWTMWSKSCELL